MKASEPLNVSVCELKKDPGFYNHKLIEVTGFVSQGFENFTLFDPTCSDWPDTWLEYGGTRPRGKRERYMVVVSRPYWLSFYAKDPAKVAWVVLAAFKSCG